MKICNIIFILILLLSIINMLYLFYGNFQWEKNKHNETVIIKDIYREIPANWPYKIPPYIFQTHQHNVVPVGMADAIKKIQKHAPECSYQFFSKNQRREFIVGYFPEALKAYDMLIPAAYQADLFRYICLYVKGGVYFDSPNNPENDIKLFGDVINVDNDFVSVLDLDLVGIYNAFIASIPRHPILKEVIRLCIYNITHMLYFDDIPNSDGCLKITGPLILRDAVDNTVGINNVNLYRLVRDDGVRIVNNEYRLYNTRYPKYEEDRKYWGQPKYIELYKKRNVYKVI